MEAKIRREQSNLFYSGLAVIVFGVWGSLKNVIYYYLHPEFLEWKNMLEDLPENVDPKLVLILGLIIAALLDFVIRYIIGRGAIRESRRTVSKRKNGYRVLAILYLLVDVFSYAHAVREVFVATSVEELLASYDINNHFIMLIIEITSCWAMIGLIVASFKLRKYERNIEVVI